jgi:2-phosphosulfolactate phosphatase
MLYTQPGRDHDQQPRCSIMSKIHLLLKKEEINPQKINDNKVVVIFDILLATSTITTALQFGAKEVIPVLNGEEALKEAASRENGSYCLVGEFQGRTIDGFLSPNPWQLRNSLQDKTVILSTTNGTVALKKCAVAKKVYAASILNGKAVANHLKTTLIDETIILVCSGSSGEFNVEDLYGAGYFINCLVNEAGEEWELTDSAFAALNFYLAYKEVGKEILSQSRVGKMLIANGYKEEIEFISRESIFSIVPILKDCKSLTLL